MEKNNKSHIFSKSAQIFTTQSFNRALYPLTKGIRPLSQCNCIFSSIFFIRFQWCCQHFSFLKETQIGFFISTEFLAGGKDREKLN